MRFTIFCLLLFISTTVSAQITPDAPAPNSPTSPANKLDKKWFTGGNFWVQFGTYTYIDISPTIGYKVNNRFRPGVGVTYQYQRTKTQFGVFQQNVYGARAFSSYQLLDNIFAYAEYELLNVTDYWSRPSDTRVWLNSVWLGGGYRRWLGPNSAMDIMVLYDTQFQNDSVKPFIYGSPINFKLGFIIGI